MKFKSSTKKTFLVYLIIIVSLFFFLDIFFSHCIMNEFHKPTKTFIELEKFKSTITTSKVVERDIQEKIYLSLVDTMHKHPLGILRLVTDIFFIFSKIKLFMTYDCKLPRCTICDSEIVILNFNIIEWWNLITKNKEYFNLFATIYIYIAFILWAILSLVRQKKSNSYFRTVLYVSNWAEKVKDTFNIKLELLVKLVLYVLDEKVLYFFLLFSSVKTLFIYIYKFFELNIILDTLYKLFDPFIIKQLLLVFTVLVTYLSPWQVTTPQAVTQSFILNSFIAGIPAIKLYLAYSVFVVIIKLLATKYSNIKVKYLNISDKFVIIICFFLLITIF